jgi:hypothetical protein
LERTWPERYASIVEVVTTDGRTLSCRVDDAKGSMGNPLTPDEIRAKYLRLAATVTTPAHAERIAEMAARVERLADIADLAALLRTCPKSLRHTGKARKASWRTRRIPSYQQGHRASERRGALASGW